MSQFTTIEYSVHNGIATITLNRPKALNAITKAMYEEMPVALRRAADDKNVAITLLTGVGRFFSSGADVTEKPTEEPPSLSDSDATRDYYRRRFDGTIARWALAMIEHPKVLVVALNGPVVGVAAALISHADIIYISDTTTLHAPFSSLAISPEAGSSYMFVKRLGHAKAMEALLFSKKFASGELVGCGFANKMFPTEGFHEHVRKELGGVLKGVHPTSLNVTKRLIHSNFKREETAAVFKEVKELTERFVSGDPQKVFAALAAKYGKSKL